MPAGRPTKYTPELMEKATWYVDHFRELGEVIATEVGMALYCGISEDTLHSWKKHEDKAEFSELCARVLGMQKRDLICGGLSRAYDSGLSKLLLGNHGIKEQIKTDNDHNHRGTGVMMVPIASSLDEWTNAAERSQSNLMDESTNI